jgi:phospholipid/cholesterol/gamma-HCH transport system substrate-binding protein
MLFTAGIIFFAFWLGNTGFKDDYDLYLLRTKESVSGLSKDSGVKLKGVDIGTVSAIEVNPKNIEEVEITLKITKGIPIKEDMQGTISMFGLTGLSYVEIEGGTNGAKTLHPAEGELPVIQSGSSLLGRLENNFEDLSEKLIVILERGEQLLSDDNLNNFSALLDNANKVAAKGADVEEKMITTLDEAESALKEFKVSFAKLSKDFDLLAVDLHKEMKPSLKKFDGMTKSIDELAFEIRKTVNRGDYNMQKIMQPTISDLRVLSEQIDALTRQLRESPSDLLYKSSKPRRGPGE